MPATAADTSIQSSMKSGVSTTEPGPNTSTAAPIGRPVRPDEMAASVLFLCWDAVSYVTGHVHVTGGGATVRGMFPSDMVGAVQP